MPENRKLEREEIVRVNPVLGRLADKGALTSTSGRVALNRVAPRPDEIVEFRELHNDRIPIVLVERTLLEVLLNERGLEWYLGLFLETQDKERA